MHDTNQTSDLWKTQRRRRVVSLSASLVTAFTSTSPQLSSTSRFTLADQTPWLRPGRPSRARGTTALTAAPRHLASR